MPMPLKRLVVMAMVAHMPMSCTRTGLLVMRPSLNCCLIFMLQPSLTQRLGRVDDGLHFGDDSAGRDRRAGDGRDRALVLRQRKAVALADEIVAPGTVGGVGRLGAEAGGLGVLGDVHTGAVIVAVETETMVIMPCAPENVVSAT